MLRELMDEKSDVTLVEIQAELSAHVVPFSVG
jgi:hypothetical protein